MKPFLNWFARSPRGNPAPSSRRPFRPQLESLGERVVPSVSSAISIYDSHGNITERDWFTVDEFTNRVVEFQGITRHDLGGPSGVFAVSASVDPSTGHGEVFALAYAGGAFGTGVLWRCDSHGNWSNPFSGLYEGISATHDGHVYAVTASGSAVEYFNSNGTGTSLGAPASGLGASSLAATVSLLGLNEVYAIGGNGALYVNQGNSPGNWQLVDNHAQFVSLSAINPDFAVFAVTTSGRLFQENESFFWNGYGFSYLWTDQDISGGRSWGPTISADLDGQSHPEVYAIQQGTNNLYLYNQGHWFAEGSHVFDVAAAGGGLFYDVTFYVGQYYAYLFCPQCNHWFPLGSGLY
jgi:hypothetical protein